MSDDQDSTARDKHLAFYLALDSPSRIAVIDALKAWGPLTVKELGRTMVAAGDIAPQAAVNLGRGHLAALEVAGLVEKFVDRDDRELKYREGPALTGAGIQWSGLDEDDTELLAAAHEFQRVRVEHRLNRMRTWAHTRWEWPEEWTKQTIGRDNIVRCTSDELAELDGSIAAVFREWDDKVQRRRDLSGAAGERPCFRAVTAFPIGSPSLAVDD